MTQAGMGAIHNDAFEWQGGWQTRVIQRNLAIVSSCNDSHGRQIGWCWNVGHKGVLLWGHVLEGLLDEHKN